MHQYIDSYYTSHYTTFNDTTYIFSLLQESVGHYRVMSTFLVYSTTTLAMCVLILLTWTYPVAETRLYIIAPHKNIAGCSEDSRCVSFTTFLQNTSKYLSSNTTVNFYPGLYKIEHSSSNQNVSRYSMDVIGQTNVSVGTHRVSLETDKKLRAEIHCKQMFKVTWAIIQSKNVHIQNIAMIECSASVINRENQARNIQFGTILETATTFLMAKVTNITLTNIQARSSNGTVLLAVHVEERLSIVSSKINGTVQVRYPEQLTLNRNTTLQVKNSQIIPAIRYTSRQVY